jgi:sirohydrochlorin cobaltochelatase
MMSVNSGALLAVPGAVGLGFGVMQEDFSDAALVLVGHGSTQNEGSAAPVFQHATELRRRRLFSQVREGFWKQEPQVVKVLAELSEARIFIVPLFISEGYFSEEVIPRALGFCFPESGPFHRTREQGKQKLVYCRPVGSHQSMTKVLLARTREVVEKFPFPRAPKPKDISLFVAGHGTEQNENSRKAVERQVEIIRAQNLYADVQGVFLEEEPRISACYQLAGTKNVVLVPFFISDGLHVQQDIPVMLGEPERLVRQRLQNGQPGWRNPTEKQGKLVWCAGSVGTEPMLADVILERVGEGAHGGNPKAEGRSSKEG